MYHGRFSNGDRNKDEQEWIHLDKLDQHEQSEIDLFVVRAERTLDESLMTYYTELW